MDRSSGVLANKHLSVRRIHSLRWTGRHQWAGRPGRAGLAL